MQTFQEKSQGEIRATRRPFRWKDGHGYGRIARNRCWNRAPLDSRRSRSCIFTYSTSEAKAQELQIEIEESGGRSLAIKADSASASRLKEAVRDAANTLGGLDIFVSNAGIFKVGLVDQFALEAYDWPGNVRELETSSSVRLFFPAPAHCG